MIFQETRAGHQTDCAGQAVAQQPPAAPPKAQAGLLSPPGGPGSVHVPPEDNDDHGAAPGAADQQGR